MGSNVGHLLFVAAFFVVGALFVFSALPHTEILRIARIENGFLCTWAQALAGRWEVFEKTVTMGPVAECELRRQEDDGSVTYRARIVGDDVELAFGKSKGDRATVQATADRVNDFLSSSTGGGPTLEIREDVWWWWMAPFGLLAMGIGLAGLRAQRSPSPGR